MKLEDLIELGMVVELASAYAGVSVGVGIGGGFLRDKVFCRPYTDIDLYIFSPYWDSGDRALNHRRAAEFNAQLIKTLEEYYKGDVSSDIRYSKSFSNDDLAMYESAGFCDYLMYRSTFYTSPKISGKTLDVLYVNKPIAAVGSSFDAGVSQIMLALSGNNYHLVVTDEFIKSYNMDVGSLLYEVEYNATGKITTAYLNKLERKAYSVSMIPIDNNRNKVYYMDVLSRQTINFSHISEDIKKSINGILNKIVDSF